MVARSDPLEVEMRRTRRMELIDSLTPDLRNLVHEYGFGVVEQFMHLGVSNHRHIRHLVETVLNELSSTRGARSFQGPHRAGPTPTPPISGE